MKLTVILLMLPLLITSSSTAQDILPNFHAKLIASREGHHRTYSPGTKLLIKYNDGSSIRRVKGTFLGAADGNVIIGKKHGNVPVASIPVENIAMLRKVKPGDRIAFAIIGAVAVGGSVALLNSENSPHGSAMLVVLLIPVIGGGTYLLCAIPVTLLIEKLMEIHRSDGWTFELSGK